MKQTKKFKIIDKITIKRDTSCGIINWNGLWKPLLIKEKKWPREYY